MREKLLAILNRVESLRKSAGYRMYAGAFGLDAVLNDVVGLLAELVQRIEDLEKRNA